MYKPRINIYRVKCSHFKGYKYLTAKALLELQKQFDQQDIHGHQCIAVQDLVGINVDLDKPVFDFNHAYEHAPSQVDMLIQIGPLANYMIKE